MLTQILQNVKLLYNNTDDYRATTLSLHFLQNKLSRKCQSSRGDCSSKILSGHKKNQSADSTGRTAFSQCQDAFPANTLLYYINPLPDNKILDWPKLKQIAYDILKCI